MASTTEGVRWERTPGYAFGMRRAGQYISALCTGLVAVAIFEQVVERLFGVLSGVGAVIYTVSSILLLAVTTAGVFSVLASPEARGADRSVAS